MGVADTTLIMASFLEPRSVSDVVRYGDPVAFDFSVWAHAVLSSHCLEVLEGNYISAVESLAKHAQISGNSFRSYICFDGDIPPAKQGECDTGTLHMQRWFERGLQALCICNANTE